MKKRIIRFGKNKKIGGDSFVVMAGPCAAESQSQMMEAALGVSRLGADVFRSSFFKPRTLPTSFQGCGVIGFRWLKKIKKKIDIPTMIEVRTPEQIEMALENGVDILWIGARNAQNYDLLIEIGKMTAGSNTPVLLKRGFSMRLNEWLGSAEYVILNGNPNVILCERGLTTFDPQTTRGILDLQTAWVAKKESGLPVVIDPSHAAGRRDLILPMSLAAKAAGLDGILVEVHPSPQKALTDKNQQISLSQFKKLMEELRKI